MLFSSREALVTGFHETGPSREIVAMPLVVVEQLFKPIGYSNRTERIYNWICYCHYKRIVISKLN